MIRLFQIVFTFFLLSCDQSDNNISDNEITGQQQNFGEITEMATGLTAPWGLTFLPDGSLLISSRTTAEIHRVPSMGGTPQLVGTVPGVSFSAEGGLLGLETSAAFEVDRIIYAYVSAQPSNRIVSIRIAEDFSALEVTGVLLDGITTANRHHGGRLQIGQDGNLWIGTGDAFQPDLAQDTGSLNANMQSGKLFEDYYHNKPALGKVKIKDFAKEFATVFKEK